MAQATAISPQSLINTAKATINAYNDKNWDKAKATMTTDFVYDEVGTRRKLQGIDEVLDAWKGWARAFPDSKATFHTALVQDNTVVLEVTWNGTHQGLLETPHGSIPATGKPIEIRACGLMEVAGEKNRAWRHYFDMATMLEQLGINS